MEENGKPLAEAQGRREGPGEREERETEAFPAWWPRPAVPDEAPEGTGRLVSRLEGRLFGSAPARGKASDGEAPGGDAASASPAALGSAVAALRSSILEMDRNATPRGRSRELHRRLDRESARLAEEMLERAVDESRELLEHVSHDIRSPLNSVLFLADTLLSEHSGTLNEVQRRQVGVLYTATVTLVNLVNDLIDASRLERRGEIQVRHLSFSVEAVLNEVKSLLGPLAAHRGAELRFHLETVGPRTGDRQVLSRLLINLITNAVQATGEEGRVDVTVSEPREAWLRLEVRDDGTGSDVAELERTIERGSRSPYPLENRKGWTHGLGLMITSRLVDAAGGRIDVESELDEGTRFTVQLPFPRAE